MSKKRMPQQRSVWDRWPLSDEEEPGRKNLEARRREPTAGAASFNGYPGAAPTGCSRVLPLYEMDERT